MSRPLNRRLATEQAETQAELPYLEQKSYPIPCSFFIFLFIGVQDEYQMVGFYEYTDLNCPDCILWVYSSAGTTVRPMRAPNNGRHA